MLLSWGEVEVVIQVPPHTGSSIVLKNPVELSGMGTCCFRRGLPVGWGPLCEPQVCSLISGGAPSNSIGLISQGLGSCVRTGNLVMEAVFLIVIDCGIKVKCAPEVPVTWV